MNAQFKKGVLELCVLSLLKQKTSYGYELAVRINQSFQIAEGTLYPLMRKLRAEGLCETYLSEDSAGPPRKYYRLTGKGLAVEAVLRGEWIDFSAQVNDIIGGNRNDAQ